MSDTRDEAAHNAMIFAREASQDEGRRLRAEESWRVLAEQQPEGWKRRIDELHIEIKEATASRDIAITLATMWAAVADVQDPL